MAAKHLVVWRSRVAKLRWHLAAARIKYKRNRCNAAAITRSASTPAARIGTLASAAQHRIKRQRHHGRGAPSRCGGKQLIASTSARSNDNQ